MSRGAVVARAHAQFNLTFDPLTSRGSSLATVAGVYSITGSTSAVTITTTGQVTFNSALCIGNGAIAPVDPTMNIYSWSLTFTSVAGQTCAAPSAPSGLAMLRDFNGGVGNQIFMVGAQANQAFFLVMSK